MCCIYIIWIIERAIDLILYNHRAGKSIPLAKNDVFMRTLWGRVEKYYEPY